MSKKITIAEMRRQGVRGILIYCADYHCSHSLAISADLRPDDVRLSDHPAHASTGRDDVRILKNIQGRRRKTNICHLAMPVTHFDGLLGTIPESLPRCRLYSKVSCEEEGSRPTTDLLRRLPTEVIRSPS
jgi:hypothetical protein